MDWTSLQLRWRIELLGGLRASSSGRPVVLRTSLLALLSYRPDRPYPREALIELRWPEEGPDTTRPLRQTLNSFRRTLEAEGNTEAELGMPQS